MYRQFDSSDKPKSAARLLAEAAFAPSSSRHAGDTAAPVVKVINRRFTLQDRGFQDRGLQDRGLQQGRSHRPASNDAQPGPALSVLAPDAAATDGLLHAPQTHLTEVQQAPQTSEIAPARQAAPAAKAARVFLLPAPAVEAGPANEETAAPALSSLSFATSPADLLAETPGVVPPLSPAQVLTALFAEPSDLSDPQVQPQGRSRLLRKSRRTSPHGPVRVIYSAPPALFAKPELGAEANGQAGDQAEDEAAGHGLTSIEKAPQGQQQQPRQLESILFLQQQMDEIDALFADIQYAENFDIDLDGASKAAELNVLLADIARLSAQFANAS